MKPELKKCPRDQENRLIRSYGRIKSRKLSDHKKYLLEKLLPKYEIAFDAVQAGPCFAGEFEKKSFEIGFGFGDFLYQKTASSDRPIWSSDNTAAQGFNLEIHLHVKQNICDGRHLDRQVF